MLYQYTFAYFREFCETQEKKADKLFDIEFNQQ